MRIPDDKFNLSIPNADQADASQSVDALPAESETATAMPASADSVEQFSPPTSDLPQLDEPNFPVGELTGTATPSAIPVVDSGREEIAHQSEIREGNPLNPYLSLFESSATIDPVLIPGDGSVAPGGTAFPDKFASVDPRQNLPENLKPQSFNLPGLADLKIAPDHFGVDLSAAGLKGVSNLDDVLGFGSSGGLQFKGFDVFNLGKNLDLVSDVTYSKSGDSNNGKYEARGTDSRGDSVVRTATWNTDENGVKSWTFREDRTLAGQIGFERIIAEGKGGSSKTVVDTFDENGKFVGRREIIEEADGFKRVDVYDSDGKLLYYTATDENGATHKYDKDGNEIKPNTDNGTKEGDEYIDPEGGPAVQTTFTPEDLARAVNIRQTVNVMPSNTDDQTPIIIDPDRGYDPSRQTDPLVTDRNPDLYESQILSTPDLGVVGSATGPDTVNPNEDSAPLTPPKPPEN